METLIDRYEEHEGPVRGVDFHVSQPLFASGGDDCKIKVWNYQLKRCLFTLTGHLDYIRTVHFHNEQPWLVSASDDQTLRIWNWQSRTCLSVLTGHNHYVMCARFHPYSDLIASASLDLTIRVWDISGLRKKAVSVASPQSTAPDFFGTGDVVIKFVLEGHSKGVNWVSFHPKIPLIVSAADDREVKLWRMSEGKAWEVDTMRGHLNNVSCAIFHPKKDIIISNSEDKSIRVWDISRQSAPACFRRDNDRYWILAAHSGRNMMAAGHDTGLIVFKLSRERPPYDSQKCFFYLQERMVRSFNHITNKDVVLFTAGSGSMGSLLPRSMLYNSLNQSEHNILLHSDADGGQYELYVSQNKSSGDVQTPLRGLGLAAVFVTRNRFAVLEQSRMILLKSFDNDTKKRIPAPTPMVDRLFSAGIGSVLCRSSDSMILFDLQTQKIVNELAVQTRYPVKYVIWSEDRKYVAMLSKFCIYIANSKLVELCTIAETSRVKSGLWDRDIFYYTTSTHMKYTLTCGDNGIVRTLDDVVYLGSMNNSTVTYLTRECELRSIEVDITEPLFKKALVHRDLDEVLRIVQSNSLIGESVIAYLQKKGYPEVALHFVQDQKTRFNLALQCGNLAVARECAVELNDKLCWDQLGDEALIQGDLRIVEMCYQRTKNFEKLAFLYLIVGNTEKLGKMLQIAKGRGDIMGRFHTSLYLGDVEERFHVLKEADQTSLAYLVASSHGLDSSEYTDDVKVDLPPVEYSSFLVPPFPIIKNDDWPKLEVKCGYFDGGIVDVKIQEEVEYPGEDKQDAEIIDLQGWDDVKAEKPLEKTPKPAGEGSAGAGWFDDLGIEVEDVGNDESQAELGYYVMPVNGQPFQQRWLSKSQNFVTAVAVGDFDGAMDRLHRAYGIVNFQPLRVFFVTIFSLMKIDVPAMYRVPAFDVPLDFNSKPIIPYSLEHCVERLKQAYKTFLDGGDFDGNEKQFREILHMTLFLDDSTPEGKREIQELLTLSKEYISAIRIELARRGMQDPVRQCELAMLFTECKLQPLHMFLGLRVAIKAAYVIKNYKTAGMFCRKFLEMVQMHKVPQSILDGVDQVTKVLKACEKVDKDAHEVNVNPHVSYSICCGTFTQISGRSEGRCPFCESSFMVDCVGILCPTCNLSRVTKI